MNISGLSRMDWFQKLETNLIDAGSMAATSAAQAAVPAASWVKIADQATSPKAPASAPKDTAPTSSTAPPLNPLGSDMMATLISAQSGGSLADKATASLIGALDSNKDGSLSLAEVQAALMGSAPAAGASDSAGSLGAQILSGFGKLDANGDGQLGATELANAMRAMEQSAANGLGWRHRHHHHSETQQAAAAPPTAAPPADPASTPSTDAAAPAVTTVAAAGASASTAA